jgi:hypothetical protein
MIRKVPKLTSSEILDLPTSGWDERIAAGGPGRIRDLYRHE